MFCMCVFSLYVFSILVFFKARKRYSYQPSVKKSPEHHSSVFFVARELHRTSHYFIRNRRTCERTICNTIKPYCYTLPWYLVPLKCWCQAFEASAAPKVPPAQSTVTVLRSPLRACQIGLNEDIVLTSSAKHQGAGHPDAYT